MTTFVKENKTNMKHFTIYKTDCMTDEETIFCFLHTTNENIKEMMKLLNDNYLNYLFTYKENKTIAI